MPGLAFETFVGVTPEGPGHGPTLYRAVGDEGRSNLAYDVHADCSS
jgi:hypothetical protein